MSVAAATSIAPVPAEHLVPPAARQLRAVARKGAEDTDLGSSVGKALAVLEAFRGAGAVLGVTEIAARTGLSKSTAHRLLAVLVDSRFVQRHDNRYMLGRAVFELGCLTPECRPHSLREAAIPVMSELYSQTRATIHLAVLEGYEVLYVEKLYGPGSVETPSRVGGRMPALATAVGKALVAFSEAEVIGEHLARPLSRLTPHTLVHRGLLAESLRQVRETGIARDREESRIGIQCLAAPILRRGSGLPIAAISVSTRASDRLTPQTETQLRVAASKIAATCTSHGL